jgi:hypothetical protein
MTDNDVYGETYFSVHDPQFSEQDLSNLFFPATLLKLGNWIQAGYIKPDYRKDPRGGRDRRRYSIVEIARISIIDGLVNCIGIAPSRAVEVADFCIPFLNDHFDRNPDRTLKSLSSIYVISWLDRSSGRMQSKVMYRKPPEDDDFAWYEDDPFLNPDAKPCGPPGHMAIVVPVTRWFMTLFINCTKYLWNRNRGLLDKWGRPVDA